MADMMCTYVQRGESIDYINAGTTLIPGGSVVVMGNIAGIANADIAPGEVGVVEVEGVYQMPSGSATFAVGDRVDWDDGSGALVAAAEDGVLIGWVIAPTTGNGFALVKLVQ